MMIKLKQYKLPTLPTWLPIAILFAGAILRLTGLLAAPFWYDEAYSIYLSRFASIMIQIDYSDFNPPLWQMVMTPFIWLFGESEFSLRLPALLCSLIAMWLAWQIALNLWPIRKHIATAIAILMAFLPYHFWLAQDGRPYALLSMLYLAVIYFGMHGRWLGLTACLGLMCYTHSVGMFYAAAAGLGLLIYRPRDWRAIIISGLVALASMAPWMPTFFSRVDNHWLGPFSPEELLKALYFSTWAGAMPNIWAYGAIILLVITWAAALVISAWRIVHKRDQQHAALTVWTVGPLAILLLVAIFRNLIFYRPLSAMLLPICIWLPAALWPATRRQWLFGGWLLPFWWGLAILIGLVSWSPVMRGGQLREITAMVNSSWAEGDIVYHATGTSYLPASLYLDHPGCILDADQHDGLLQTELQITFGICRADFDQLPHQRAWVFWSRDVLIQPTAWRRMDEITQGATLVGVIQYWQAADIYVYLVQP